MRSITEGKLVAHSMPVLGVVYEIGECPCGHIPDAPRSCHIDQEQSAIQQGISVMLGVMLTVSC